MRLSPQCEFCSLSLLLCYYFVFCLFACLSVSKTKISHCKFKLPAPLDTCLQEHPSEYLPCGVSSLNSQGIVHIRMSWGPGKMTVPGWGGKANAIKKAVFSTLRVLFFGHRSFIRKITHEAVINIVKQCITKNLTWRFVRCNIYFQKYPLLFFF